VHVYLKSITARGVAFWKGTTMARRTKADAAATRNSLLDAAERVFYEKGVSRASLTDIASAAGATRGAIYWHFKDKAELFNAMMDRVTHPLRQAINHSTSLADTAPLERLRSLMQGVLSTIEHDEHTRRVFEIALYRVEYVEDLRVVRNRHSQECAAFAALIARELSLAAADQDIQLPMPAHIAAMGVQALFDGMLQSWLLQHASFNLVVTTCDGIDTYLRGLGFRL